MTRVSFRFPRHAAAIAAGALFLTIQPAAAEKALDHAAAPLLVAAAEKAAAHADNQYAFTVDHWMSDGEKETSVRVRFDPRREEGEQWALLAPAEDDLDKRAKKAFKQLQKTEMEDNPVLYEKLDEMIEVAELHSETDTQAVYVAQVDEEDFPKDALEVYITLNKPGGYVSQIEVRSKKAFKPMPIAKVTNLVQSQTFAAPEGDGPAFLASTEGTVEGEAMFRDFKQLTRQSFSDIEKVEVISAQGSGE